MHIPRIKLLLIDPQNDFMDFPGDWLPQTQGAFPNPTPSLSVPGAHEDMLRVAAVLGTHSRAVSAIGVTLDSHQHISIERTTFWKDKAGLPVAPFTEITLEEVLQGTFTTQLPAHLPRAVAFLKALEGQGKRTLRAWPPHAELGTWGHNVHPAILQAYTQWEDVAGTAVQKFIKGSNPWTEHYSAVQADVPDPTDPGTQLNRALVDFVEESDWTIIAGEAASHCVRDTGLDLLDNLPPEKAKSFIFLKDGMSPVPGATAEFEDFIAQTTARGAVWTTCAELPGVLPALRN